MSRPWLPAPAAHPALAGCLTLAACLALELVVAPSARAESALRLPYPRSFGSVPAATYDALDRHRVGDAHLVVEELPGGVIRLIAESGIDGGARTVAYAELEPVVPGETLRVLHEESRSFDEEGHPLGVLAIDHRAAIATCTPPPGDDEPVKRVPLPAHDRVANVPLSLLFEPLAKGEVKEVSFQFLACGFGGRLLDFQAKIQENGHAGHGGGDGHLVEVRYKPDLGVLSLVAERLVPQLSMWFDPRAPTPWLAHRIPLFSKGPEVYVVRDGVPPDWLKE